MGGGVTAYAEDLEVVSARRATLGPMNEVMPLRLVIEEGPPTGRASKEALDVACPLGDVLIRLDLARGQVMRAAPEGDVPGEGDTAVHWQPPE
jgi:hypothetical protein